PGGQRRGHGPALREPGGRAAAAPSGPRRRDGPAEVQPAGHHGHLRLTPSHAATVGVTAHPVAPAAGPRPAPAPVDRTPMDQHRAPGMRVVALGTAGGPLLRPGSDPRHRSGIATAVIVEGAVYLVDCGHGVALRMAEAGLHPTDLAGI